MIGVAFLGLTKAENIGYLIPVEEVATFDDVQDGKYEGKPRMWDEFQTTDNEAPCAWLKMPREAGGCMITKPDGKDASYPLKERDVVTHMARTGSIGAATCVWGMTCK